VQEQAATWQQLAQLATTIGPALRSVGQEELVASIAATARRVFEAEACSLALLEEDGEHLAFHVVVGGSEEIVGERIPVDAGIAGWVVATGQPLAVADVQADPRFSHDIADRTGFVPTSIVALPLATDRRMLGVIEVLDARAGDDMELLMLFAHQAALAVEGGQVFDELGRHLLSAVADNMNHDLAVVLRDLAGDLEPLNPALRRIAASFGELSLLEPRELEAVADIVDTYLRHALHRSEAR
jgi:GAF domain-containing protein